MATNKCTLEEVRYQSSNTKQILIINMVSFSQKPTLAPQRDAGVVATAWAAPKHGGVRIR